MFEIDSDNQEDVSKSQRKRDMDELRHLGRELLTFSDDALRQLMLPEQLLEALRTAKKITSNSAGKRQLQYIGKLMREIDTTAVREAIEARNHQRSTHTKAFHLLEKLRDQLLLAGDRAVPDVMAHFPRADRQHLRKLVRQARSEHENRQPPRTARLLFRYLRELQQEADEY